MYQHSELKYVLLKFLFPSFYSDIFETLSGLPSTDILRRLCAPIFEYRPVYSTSPFIPIAMELEVRVHELLIFMLDVDELVDAVTAHFSATKTDI